MTHDEAITLLEKGTANAALRGPLRSALALIRQSPSAVVKDFRCSAGERRDVLLALFRKRAALASRRGRPVVEGLEETIRSFASDDSDRVHLITIDPFGSPFHIAIHMGDDDLPIGCVIGRVSDDFRRPGSPTG